MRPVTTNRHATLFPSLPLTSPHFPHFPSPPLSFSSLFLSPVLHSSPFLFLPHLFFLQSISYFFSLCSSLPSPFSSLLLSLLPPFLSLSLSSYFSYSFILFHHFISISSFLHYYLLYRFLILTTSFFSSSSSSSFLFHFLLSLLPSFTFLPLPQEPHRTNKERNKQTNKQTNKQKKEEG